MTDQKTQYVDDINMLYSLCLEYYQNGQYSKFLRYIFVITDENHIESILLLADYFIKVKQSDEAIYYWKKSINLGSILGIARLGRYYELNKQFVDAISIYRLGVIKGDTTSMVQLGLIYYDKLKNYDHAFEVWSLGASKDDLVCIYNMGFCYQIKNDIESSIGCWIRSGNMGHKDSIIKVLEYYLKNNNMERCIYWLSKLDEKDKLIQNIYEYLNVKNTAEPTKDFLEILSNLKEEDLKDIPLYLKIIIRLLKQNLERVFFHCEYKPNGGGYNEVKNEYLKTLLEAKSTKLKEKVEDVIIYKRRYSI